MWLKTYKIKNDYIKSYAIQLKRKNLVSYQYNKDGGWFRIFNTGISWTTTPLYSVRNGHKKSLKIKNVYFTLLW